MSTTRQRQQDQDQQPDEAQACCFLCVEPLDASNTIGRSCCNKKNELYQNCFYRHIMSILDIGLVRQMTCPLGCRKPLTDLEIRECFRRQHQTFWTNLLRWIIYSIASIFGRSYTIWRYTRLETKERRDLDRYETWSLQRGLADLRKKEDNDNFILLQCPGTDCAFQWIVADPQHRRAKQQHEERPYFWLYAPYRVPERTPENFLFWTQ